MTSVNQYDPLLGWRLRDNMRDTGINTLDHGIRQNGSETEIRKGGILAVGDSFTAGSEVADCESWPAQLEALTGLPVLNGATGGWGVDQIVMRIEQLIPVVEPRLILFGLLDQDITRCSYSFGGKPKPYFMVEGGDLVLKHYPVPIHHKGSVALLWEEIKAMMPRLEPEGDMVDFWADWGRDGVSTGADPVDIACRLVKRLRAVTTIPIVMVMQYGGYVVSRLPGPPDYANTVMGCAEEEGIPVIEEFGALRCIWNFSVTAFEDHYVMHGPGAYGHMSARGNSLIARLIRDRLVDLNLLPPPIANIA